MKIASSLLNAEVKKPLRYKWITIIIVFALTLLMMFVSQTGEGGIYASDLRFTAVQKKDLQVRVDGFGRLKSKYNRYLTSRSAGIVEEIHVYPGTRVAKDTVIMTLSSPELERQLTAASLELARYRAQLKEQVILHQSQLLERDAQIALLESQLEGVLLRGTAEHKLLEKGIVSTLDYRRTQLDIKQFNKRLQIDRERRTQLREMQKESIKISQDLVSQYQSNYQSIVSLHQRLSVVADMDGVLQGLSVDIGQSVGAGTQLAKVGSEDSLVAQLRVPHRGSDTIARDMPAVVTTFGHTINGIVRRIDPVVTDGRVMVELELTGTLPANAKPELVVNGYVVTGLHSDALVINKPFNSQSNSRQLVFKHGEAHQLRREQMRFGVSSGQFIEILSGAEEGDTIVISDMSEWLEFERITLL